MIQTMKTCLLLLLATALLSGCAGLDRRDRLSKLEKSLEGYAAALRWARYSDAYDFLRARDGSKPELRLDGFENYRVADLEIIRSDLNQDETEANTYVVLRYYKDTSGTIKEHKQVQDWWYDDEAGRWFLEGDLPYPDQMGDGKG